MKKHFTCLIFVLFTATCLFAQTVDKTVEAINKRYADIAEKARLAETDDDQGEYGDLFVNELTINSRSHQWRAVGTYGRSFKFFYKAVENNEHRLYPDQLVFVKSTHRVSDRTYLEEYLYSDLGELIFYSRKAENDTEPPVSRRIYFSRGAVIRTIDDGKTRDRLSAAEYKNIAPIQRDASKLKDLFTRSINL